MRKENSVKKNPWRRVLRFAILAAVLLSLTAVCMSLFVSRHALRTAEEYRTQFPETVITLDPDGSVKLIPGQGTEQKQSGLIFYIGAQITPDAYIPLLARLAEQGYFCAVPKIPFNMASLKPGAAETVIAEHPEIKRWYLAGHSMGGYTASGFCADHSEQVSGLILIGAYTARDLSDASLPVLSVYGDADGVLNLSLYEKRRAWNPAGFEEHILPGANHAQFGDYGDQPRDNDARISMDTQQEETALIICDWLARQESKETASR